MPEPTDKRAYPRFPVPGAVLSYKKETCQVVNLGKGGLAFSTYNRVKRGQKLSVLLTFSEKQAPIQLHGQTAYCMPDPGESTRYTVGIRFAPFATGVGCNSPESYKILEQLEYTNVEQRARSIHRRSPPLVPAVGR